MKQQTSGGNLSGESEQELLPLLLLVWSKKFYIGAFLLAGLVLGAMIGLQKTPVYKADALLQLEPKKSGISLSDDISDLMSSDSEVGAEIEVLKSRMIIGKTVDNLNLDTAVIPKQLGSGQHSSTKTSTVSLPEQTPIVKS